MSFCCEPSSHDIAKPSCLIPFDEKGIIEPTPGGPTDPELLCEGHQSANEIQLLSFVLAAKFAQEDRRSGFNSWRLCDLLKRFVDFNDPRTVKLGVGAD